MIRTIYIWGPVLCMVIIRAVVAAFTLEKRLPAILKELAARETAEA
jgi:Na+/melibiose symporter-like transporter